jgi:hypothetical protein
MKQIFSILILATMLWSCGNNDQNKALSDAKQAQAAVKQMQPGGIATTEGGLTMKAKIDGKDWVANSIIPPDLAGRISGDNGGESIGLPYDRRGMVVGEKTKFSHDNAVDLMLPDDEGGILGGYAGEMEITKVDENWAEGKFFFTGSSSRSDKKVEVTDGFFRISLAKK